MNHAKSWHPVATRAVVAGGVIREGRFVVKGSSVGQVVEGSTAGTVPPLGVSVQAAEASGDSLDIACVPGMIAKVEAGTAVAHGDLITFNNAGEGIPATDGSEYLCGRALEGASDGEYFACQIWSPLKLQEQAGTFAALTDNTSGTANDTLQALADGTTYANDVAAIRNNFADLAAKINEIRTSLRNAKIVA